MKRDAAWPGVKRDRRARTESFLRDELCVRVVESNEIKTLFASLVATLVFKNLFAIVVARRYNVLLL